MKILSVLLLVCAIGFSVGAEGEDDDTEYPSYPQSENDEADDDGSDGAVDDTGSSETSDDNEEGASDDSDHIEKRGVKIRVKYPAYQPQPVPLYPKPVYHHGNSWSHTWVKTPKYEYGYKINHPVKPIYFNGRR